MEILFNLLFVPLIILINTLLKKNNYLLNYSGLKHQTYTNQKSVPLSGGLIILVFLTINFNNYESFFLISLYLFFLIAILGDLNLISSASIRFSSYLLRYKRLDASTTNAKIFTLKILRVNGDINMVLKKYREASKFSPTCIIKSELT